MSVNQNVDSKIVLRAGLWYTICNFVMKAMAFITTPIFTRLISQSDYGAVTNIASWLSIFMVLTALDIEMTIIRSKLEFEHDLDNYMLSLLTITTVSTTVVYVIILIFRNFFESIMMVDFKIISVLFLYLLLAPAYNMIMTRQRAFYKYKKFVLLTAISLLSSTILSLVLVVLMSDKMLGRLIGQYLPLTVLGLAAYIFIIAKGKKVKLEYVKYALKICLPLVPHILAMYLLGTSDRTIISKLDSLEATAIYSVAYSCTHIITVLLDSMNKAYAPWLFDNLHLKNYDQIRKVSIPYFLVFLFLIFGVLLLTPEVILILGGKSYMDAVYCLPPLAAGCTCMFIYTMYVQIEFYLKDTKLVPLATIAAVLVNISLNLLAIPRYGYVAAAYNTMIGYMLLLLFHYLIVKKHGMEQLFDRKIFLLALLVVLALIPLCFWLYRQTVIRWIIIVCYGCALLFMLYKNRNLIKQLLSSRQKKTEKSAG